MAGVCSREIVEIGEIFRPTRGTLIKRSIRRSTGIQHAGRLQRPQELAEVGR